MADDWSRSSFFNPDTETTTLVPNDYTTQSPDADDDAEDSQDDFNIDFPDNNQNADDYENDSDDNSPQNNETQDGPVSDNPIMNELVNIMIKRFEHLVERGFLNPSFLTKIKTDPQEILRFIRQNRAVVGDQLNRRLDPTIRPKPEQLERLGIVPRGYFKAGQHAQAMKRKHRRKSTASQDLAHLIQLRPNPEALVAKGIVDRSDLERQIDLDESKLDAELDYSIQSAINAGNNTKHTTTPNPLAGLDDGDDNKYDNSYAQQQPVANGGGGALNATIPVQQQQQPNANTAAINNSINANTINTDQAISSLQQANDNTQANNAMQAIVASSNQLQAPQQQQQTWEISILGTLLFKTIAEALRKSCLDTQKQEQLVLLQMEEMNNEMKHLRDALDKYFLNDEPDVLLFQKEEEMIRDKFHGIQKKLLAISTKQNSIHEKLRILHSVEKKMIDLQNIYDKQLGQLRKNEEDVLKDLKEQRIRREKAIKIRIAEKSHSNWAMAKLDYTISVAQKNKIDDDFIGHLDGFLNKLRNISENQNNIVRDFDFAIDELESQLLSIRHDMSKVRTMTFKKIYDLHKQVEIAESLELGNRRYSVASATEIERERRHHTTKIQRQLNTLNNQIKIFNYKVHEKNLREIIDIQLVMSDNKLKSFFSVFTQCFSQAICDIDLCYQNLSCLMDEKESKGQDEEEDEDDDDDDGFGGSSSSDDDLSGLYSHKKGRKRRKSKSALTTIHDANKTKIRQLCMELYGISSILLKCSLNDNSRYRKKKQSDLTLVEKIVHVMKFIQISKNALLYELQKAYYQMNELDGNDMSNFDLNQVKFKIETSRINEIIIIIGRKLSIDDHMIDDIDRTNDDQIGILAQMRVKAVFDAIIKAQDLNKIFDRKPLSRMAVATDILKYVFGIDNNEANDSYLN